MEVKEKLCAYGSEDGRCRIRMNGPNQQRSSDQGGHQF